MTKSEQEQYGLVNHDEDGIDAVNFDNYNYEDKVSLDSDFDDLVFEDDILLF